MRLAIVITEDTKIWRDGSETVISLRDFDGSLFRDILKAVDKEARKIPVLGEVKAD